MSTETPTATPEVDPKATPVEPVAPTETPAAQAVEEPLGESGLKALQSERDARKAAEKRIADFEAKEKERNDAAMSELEKANARADAAEKSASEAAAKVLRADVAATKKVDAALLTGTTQEELEASADRLLAWKGTTPSVPSAVGQGAVGTPITPPANQLEGIDADILDAQKARDFTKVIALKERRSELAAKNSKE